MHKSNLFIAVAVFFLCCVGIAQAFVYVTEDDYGVQHRYDTETGVAEYSTGDDVWVVDENTETNPAYLLYLTACDGNIGIDPTTFRDALNLNEAHMLSLSGYNMLLMAMQAFAAMPLQAQASVVMTASQEEESTLPDWEFALTAGGGYSSIDFDATAVGARFESNVTDLWLFFAARKDDLFLNTKAIYSHSEGEGVFSGFDDNYYGLLLQPGYLLLKQDTHGVDVMGYGLLELGYRDTDQIESQMRLSPGIGIDISHTSKIGRIATGYTYVNSRNMDGDDEFSGKSYFNSHNTYVAYMVPLTKKIMGNLNLSYSWVDDVPAGINDDWFTLEGGVSASLAENVNLDFSYFHDLADSNGQGFSLGVQFVW